MSLGIALSALDIVEQGEALCADAEAQGAGAYRYLSIAFGNADGRFYACRGAAIPAEGEGALLACRQVCLEVDEHPLNAAVAPVR